MIKKMLVDKILKRQVPCVYDHVLPLIRHSLETTVRPNNKIKENVHDIKLKACELTVPERTQAKVKYDNMFKFTNH